MPKPKPRHTRIPGTLPLAILWHLYRCNGTVPIDVLRTKLASHRGKRSKPLHRYHWWNTAKPMMNDRLITAKRATHGHKSGSVTITARGLVMLRRAMSIFDIDIKDKRWNHKRPPSR